MGKTAYTRRLEVPPEWTPTAAEHEQGGAPRDPRYTEPTTPVKPAFITALVFAQLAFYVALLGPATVGISVKVQSIVPDAEKASTLGTVAGFGALAAVVGNVLFGRLSDRTTSRFGRRRPWIVGGTVVMALALLIVALGQSMQVVTAGWCLAQLGANAALGPFLATTSDQVPTFQRGGVSALLGIAQNTAILGGTYVAEIFADNLLVSFVGPSLVAIAAMLLFAFVLPDQKLPARPPRMTPRDWLGTVWVNPVRYPDFAFAWCSRFLIALSSFMFTTFRLFYLQDELDLSAGEAPHAVTVGVLVYTVALLVCGWVAGRVSDRTGRRKLLVAGAALLFGIGIIALVLFVDTVQAFYVVEAILGAASGIYVGVDFALVLDVLPNPDDAGKDLGVINIANALPQSLAPVIGAALLSVGDTRHGNYSLLFWTAGAAAALGALVVLPIKKVK